MMSTTNILVVGQTPPPLHGQAIMIQSFLEGSYQDFRLTHVRMNFSRSVDEVGSFRLRKLSVLMTVLVEIVRARWHGAAVLYYPPAGPKRNAILRDMVLLGATRWMFRKTVFHFHAAGLCEFYPRLRWWERPLFRFAYSRPNLAIFTSASTSSEASLLKAESVAIVPCGIEDEAGAYLAAGAKAVEPPMILFAGVLCEAKGVLVLLEACSLLVKAGCDFRLVCIGAFDSRRFQREVDNWVEEYDLNHVVRWPGVLRGQVKADVFAACSIFCFPTHYQSESAPIVLLEAMSFAKPIVTTRWRGIPEVVGDEGGAVLVETKDPAAVAKALEELLRSPDRRREMGVRNRERYLRQFTLERYRRNMEEALRQVIAVPAASAEDSLGRGDEPLHHG
jgi:glycosyltransferase involved in cell wall biosynthesis